MTQYGTDEDAPSAQPSLPRILVQPCFIAKPSILSHWRYEARREAQQIVPWLWLGPAGVLRDHEFIASQNISILVSLSAAVPAKAVHELCAASSTPIEQFAFQPCYGDQISKMVTQFDEINLVLDEVRRQDKRVLVFCESGNDRSAAACAAYLMALEGLDFASAIQKVQSFRFSICLDDVAKYNLCTYESILQARAAAKGAANSAPKRTLEEDEDEDNTTRHRRLDNDFIVA
ncbi:hypothetical protein TRVA0_005S03026 [Trichomonascus vanleenenianus]|uniref:dual specificity protein phosphatase family protein n=1 Tax=Trichomonascus vanleenenianus TaxID=2268995 RepID=UPI003EC983BA